MGIQIGDNNKIKDSLISDNSNIQNTKEKENWVARHPLITTIIATIISSVILMFSFWEQIVKFIESLLLR